MAVLKKKRLQKFTIVEILVAMSVFAVLMLIIMQIFGSLQNVWTTTSKRTQTAQNANMIMNMIAADLQSAYYNADASADSSWCYYQNSVELGGTDKPVWFITSRQKSVQATGSSLVQSGYWLEDATRDEAELKVLKNLTISNVKYDGISTDTASLYNHKTAKEPDSKLRTVHSDLSKIATLVDDNIVSLKVTPYVKKINPENGEISWDNSGTCTRLPAYVEIELKLLDDDPTVRAAYKEADSGEREKMVRTYTRVIEINRGQYYE